MAILQFLLHNNAVCILYVGKCWRSLTWSSLSRQSSKVNFQLCSRLREAFGMGSGFVNMEVYVIVPNKSQTSPKQVPNKSPSKSQLSLIIFPQSCELDGRRMGDEGEEERVSKWKNVNLRLFFRHRLRKKRQYFNI